MKKITTLKSLLFLTFFILFFVISQEIRTEDKRQILIGTQAIAAPPPYNPQALYARNTRARQLWQLWQLWQTRNQRDIAKKVTPFLQDENSTIRQSAVKVLSRLETRSAEQALAQNSIAAALPPLTLRLALARIRSRHLKGRARVEAVTGAVDLSYREFARLSQQIHASPYPYLSNTQGYEIVEEIIDLLCMMARQGQNIQPMVKGLSLNPAQEVQLSAASLPPQQGAALIVAYLSNLDVGKAQEEVLSKYLLVEMNSVAAPALIRQLQLIKGKPSKRGQRGYVELFRSAAL